MSGIEAISSAAAIFQLAEFGCRARSCLSDIIEKAQNPSQSLEELSIQARSISDLAKSINDESSHTPSTRLLIDRCIANSTKLERLLDRLRRFPSGRGACAAQILERYKIAATWRSKEKEISSIWKEIDRSIVLLHFIVSFNSSKSLDALKRMSEETEKDPASSHVDSVNMPHTAKSAALATDRASTLPSRNARFVGQKAALGEIRQKLELPHRFVQAVALIGLGGTGKSELAIEHAHQIHQAAPEIWIFFARAYNELELVLSYSEFACRANIAAADDSLSACCQAVKSFLESEDSGRWLMIVDGVDDADALFGPQQLHNLLPQSTHGSIIFTSRCLQLALEFVSWKENVIHLDRLERDDAVELVQARLGRPGDSMDHTLELVDLLEGLPLALSQAASFILTSCGSIYKYICMFRQSDITKIGLLSEGGSHKDGSFANPVAKTWRISFERIKRDDDFAAHLLSFGACLHWQQIPTSLLPKGSNPAKDVAGLGLLEGYSMVTTSSDSDRVNMHPLVHLATRYWLESEGQLDKYMHLAFDAVYESFPERFDSENELMLGAQFSIHAQKVLENSVDKARDERHVKLASRLSEYLCAKGNYRGALPYTKTAFNWSQTVRGKSDLYTLTTLNSMVVVNWYLGNYEEAEKLCKEVVALREQVLGVENRDTLASLNNLGLIMNDQGKYEAAESLHRRVLKAREDLLGPSHNDTLKSLNNLGLSLKMQEKYEEAEEVFHKVFMERRETLGIDQIGTLKSMNNLGQVLQFRGKHAEASIILSEALRAKEILLGPRHPDTLRSKQNMAIVLMTQGQLEKSEVMAREVVDEYVRVQGDRHPDTLAARSNLAIVLREQHKYRDSERTWRQVFEVQKCQLGENHPETKFSLSRYTNVAEYLTRHPEIDEDRNHRTAAPPELD